MLDSSGDEAEAEEEAKREEPQKRRRQVGAVPLEKWLLLCL